MKALLILPALLSLGAATPPPNVPGATYISAGTPPVRFQGEASEIVIYVDDVSKLCGKAAQPGYKIIACTAFKDKTPITVLPNPCAFDDEWYAHIARHEKGHVLGWPAWHGE